MISTENSHRTGKYIYGLLSVLIMNGMLNFSYFQFVKIKCRSFPTQVMNPVLQTMAE